MSEWTTVGDSGVHQRPPLRLVGVERVEEPASRGEVEGISLPPNFCGGRAIFAVHATTSTGGQGDGLYEVNCQIHDPGGQTPPGTSEGVKVNARGINFNKHVTGDNLFVMLP